MSDYEVGYKKPPKHARWKKGQSGHPEGRPKGAVNFWTLVAKTHNMPVLVKFGGVQKKVSTIEAILLRQSESALKANLKAIKQATDLAQKYSRVLTEKEDQQLLDVDMSKFTDEELEILERAGRILDGGNKPTGSKGGGGGVDR